MFKLDERLKRIADLITFNSFADIGCDHGKLVAYKSEDCSKIIATDINEKCLAKTIKLIKENNLMSKVETRLGNGLDVIADNEVECIVIAGMGGDLIADIISANKNFDCYILSPNTHPEIVREKLIQKGYKIDVDEMLFFNRKWYPIIKATKGADIIDDLQIKYGKFYKTEPSTIEYLKYKRTLLKQINKDSLKEVIAELDNILSHVC